MCLGKATKLCGMITDWGKTYEAVMLLGKTTDTQDISGSVLSVSEVNADERKIIDVIYHLSEDMNRFHLCIRH